MNGSNHDHQDHHGGSGHGFLHMVFGCGLALLAVLALSAFDATRGSALVFVALLLCPLSMIFMMRRMSH